MAEPRDANRPGPPLWELTVARVKEVLRDPGALLWTFGFPVFLMVVLGLAFRSSPLAPQRIVLACASQDACGPLAARLAQEPRLAVQQKPLTAALRDMARGKLDLVIEVPRAGSGEPRVVYHYDPTRREAHLARLAAQVALDDRPSALPGRDRLHTERGGRYIDFLMPGVVALNLMGSGVWGIGFSIVEQRRRKLMRQLATTPMRRSDFLLSYMFSRLVFLVPEVALLFGFGALAFDTPVTGSWFAIAVVSVVGAFAFTGIGVLIGSRVESSEAAAGWANCVMMPMWLLSGVFFSYELFPEALHPTIRAMPLTALADALRAITNEGAPLAACADELGILAFWTALSFALALRLFRWQ
jgi:ABC-2 type transport system permease protein